MNGVVAQYWSIIPGGIHQVLHKPITGVDNFDGIGSLTPLAIQEYAYFIEIKLFKNYSNFNIEVNGD